MQIEKYNLKLTPGVLDYFAHLAKGKQRSQDELIEIWLSRVAFEAETLDDNLPTLKSILDIGCGNGAIDVFLNRIWTFRDIHLFDGVGAGIRQSGFKGPSVPWNNVDVAAEFVKANIANPESVITHYAALPIKIEHPVDLVHSSWSWGYHYPVGVYLETTKKLLRPGGFLCIDLRHNTNGCELIEAAGFTLLETLPVIKENADKGTRHLFVLNEGVDPGRP